MLLDFGLRRNDACTVNEQLKNTVIPAKARTQFLCPYLNSRFRGNDGVFSEDVEQTIEIIKLELGTVAFT